MYKGLGALLLATLVSTTAVAEELSVIDKLINTQATRFHNAYNEYMAACDEPETAKERRAMAVEGRLDNCRQATDNYELQADILIRLIHGDAGDPASEGSN